MGSQNRETITSDFEDVTDKFHIQKTVYGCHWQCLEHEEVFLKQSEFARVLSEC